MMLDAFTAKLLSGLASRLLDANLQLHVAEAVVRKELVREALRRTNGNVVRAAKLLGIHRNTMTRLSEQAGPKLVR